jgi:hypothetical protein
MISDRQRAGSGGTISSARARAARPPGTGTFSVAGEATAAEASDSTTLTASTAVAGEFGA